MTESARSIRGCVLSYDDAGGPPDAASGAAPMPFVWGHGLTSSRAAEDVFPLVDLGCVREDRRVIRYDARGHGASGDLVDPGEGNWDRLAADQVALLDALGVGDVAVGGASMGTATALHAAPLLGDRLRALVLAIPPTAWETRAAQTKLYDSMADLVESKGVERLIAVSSQLPPPDPFVGAADGYRRRRATVLRETEPRRLSAVYRGARGADLPPRDLVRSITVPALILAWSGDPAHPVSTSERLAELLPDSSLIVASTMGELATWTDRVRRFLRDV